MKNNILIITDALKFSTLAQEKKEKEKKTNTYKKK